MNSTKTESLVPKMETEASADGFDVRLWSPRMREFEFIRGDFNVYAQTEGASLRACFCRDCKGELLLGPNREWGWKDVAKMIPLASHMTGVPETEIRRLVAENKAFSEERMN